MEYSQENIDPKLICEICEKSFSLISSKYRHAKIVHGEAKNVCNQIFGLKNELTGHVANNHHEKHHDCKFCGKVFARYGSLSHHIKNIHEKGTYYKCDSCEKSYTQAGHLKTHIKTLHEGQRNYKCESCGKSFTQSV